MRLTLILAAMDTDIERTEKQCVPCQVHRHENPTAEIHFWKTTQKPWSRLHIDFAGTFRGRLFLYKHYKSLKWSFADKLQSAFLNTTVVQTAPMEIISSILISSEIRPIIHCSIMTPTSFIERRKTTWSEF